MTALVYPVGLPGPNVATVQSAERRLVAELDGVRQTRGIQRDRLAQQQLTFTFVRFADSATFRLWWKETLTYGAAWFAAGWPLPQGMVSGVRKFMGAPKFDYLPSIGWRVTATCEVRGRGLPPFYEPSLPIWLWLRGEPRTLPAEVYDSSTNHRTVAPQGAAAVSTAQHYLDDGSVAMLGAGDYLTTDPLPLTLGTWEVSFAAHLPTMAALGNGEHAVIFQHAVAPFNTSLDRDTINWSIGYNLAGAVWKTTGTGYVNANGNVWGFAALVFVPTADWVRMRLKRNTVGLELYIDDALAYSETNLSGIGDAGKVASTTTGALRIGRASDATPNPLRTYLDDLRITTNGDYA